MFRVFLTAFIIVLFSTPVFAGYCSEKLWRENTLKQENFSSEWRYQRTDYKTLEDNLKRFQLLHRKATASEMEAFCRKNPEKGWELLYENAEKLEYALNHIKREIEDLDELIGTGEAVMDQWHVLAGACYELNADNLKRGRKNAGTVREKLDKARQWRFALKTAYSYFEQEAFLFQHMEKVLQDIKAQADAPPESGKK